MEKEKQITLKMNANELNIDKIAHQLVVEKTFQADVNAGMPEHIAREEMMRKAYAHVKRIDDIDMALKSLATKKAKKPLVEQPEEEEDELDEEE